MNAKNDRRDGMRLVTNGTARRTRAGLAVRHPLRCGLMGSLAALTMVATTVWCAAPSAAASAPPQSKFVLPAYLKGPAPSSVKIGFAGGYTSAYLPYMVAFGAGYLDQVAKRFNTTISFDAYSGGSTAEPAFLGGTDQFTVTGIPSQISPDISGKDQIAILNLGITLSLAFLAQQKYQASRGTSVTAYGTGTSTWCQFSPVGTSNAVTLLLAGLNHIPVSNINLTTIGGPAAALPTLQSGQCTLTGSNADTAALGTIQNQTYIVTNTITPEVAIPLAGQVIGSPLNTSAGFAAQYPKLTQAIVDAMLQSELFVYANANNPNTIYQFLPSGLTQTLSLGAFVQSMQIYGSFYSNPKYNNGTFTTTDMNDSVLLTESVKTIPVGSTVDMTKVFSNKYAIQAWKDLKQPIPTGPQNGPATIPPAPGKPSQEAAQAFATLTGQPAPANSGPAPLGAIAKNSSTTTSAAATSTSS
jgi:hypothetical protein